MPLELFPRPVDDAPFSLDRLRRAAWDSANILRGAGLNLLDAIDQTSVFLFLRLVETDAGGNGPLADLADALAMPPIATCLESRHPVDTFRTTVLPALKSTVETHFPQSAYAHLVDGFSLKIEDESAFRDFAGVIESLSLDARNADVNGAIYERLIAPLAQAGHFGQFFTPKHVVDLMVTLVEPGGDGRVHDPAAGSGGFLIAAGSHARQLNRTVTITGRELDGVVRRLCILNLLMHGCSADGIQGGDSLSPVAQVDGQFDVILTNPPFAASVGNKASVGSFPVPTNSVEALFLQHVVRGLAPGGRAAVVCPEGLLANLGSDRDVRAYVLGSTTVEAVVSLPAGVFNPYTAVRTGILVLTKDGRATKSIWVFDVRADGFSLDAKRRPTPESDLPLVASGFQERIDSPLSRSVALEELATHDLRLVASRYVRTASQSSPYPMVALHELARIRREQVNPAGLGNDNVVCLGLEHVTSKTGELVSPTGEPASALRSVKTRFLPGDILYGKLRPYLAKVVRAEFAAIATTEFVVLEVVDSRADPEYLVRTMRSPEFTEAATALMVGANHPRISPKDLMSIEIPLPPLEVQSRIADSAMRMEERARQRRVEADGLSRTADALVASVWTQEPDWP